MGSGNRVWVIFCVVNVLILRIRYFYRIMDLVGMVLVVLLKCLKNEFYIDFLVEFMKMVCLFIVCYCRII